MVSLFHPHSFLSLVMVDLGERKSAPVNIVRQKLPIWQQPAIAMIDRWLESHKQAEPKACHTF